MLLLLTVYSGPVTDNRLPQAEWQDRLLVILQQPMTLLPQAMYGRKQDILEQVQAQYIWLIQRQPPVTY